MKKIKYWILLVFILIILGIGFINLISSTKDKDKITLKDQLNSNDKINDNKIHGKNTSYELKSIKVITSENYYTSPTFSPDGKKIAFTNLNFKGIFVENIADGIRKKISGDDGAGFRFSWSPDSKEIVFLSRELKNEVPDFSIKLMEIENGKISELTTKGVGASMPYFTQTNEIIYSYKGTLIKRKWNGASVGAEEIIAQNVPANIIIPSPKGDKLIIEDDDGIKIVDSNGENRKIIIKNSANSFAYNSKFSFDGNKVMFFNNVGATEHLYVYDINIEKTIDLGEGSMGQWLPNGRIIYCIIINDGNVNTASDLYIINSDGTSKMRITNTIDQIEVQPTIWPDGKSIAYRDDKSGRIYIGFLLEKNNY